MLIRIGGNETAVVIKSEEQETVDWKGGGEEVRQDVGRNDKSLKLLNEAKMLIRGEVIQ